MLPEYRMESDVAEHSLREISENFNLNIELKDLLEGEVFEVNELVCNGKIKASFLIYCDNGKNHILEIVEDDLVHITVNGEQI